MSRVPKEAPPEEAEEAEEVLQPVEDKTRPKGKPPKKKKEKKRQATEAPDRVPLCKEPPLDGGGDGGGLVGNSSNNSTRSSSTHSSTHSHGTHGATSTTIRTGGGCVLPVSFLLSASVLGFPEPSVAPRPPRFRAPERLWTPPYKCLPSALRSPCAPLNWTPFSGPHFPNPRFPPVLRLVVVGSSPICGLSLSGGSPP